MVFVRTWYHLTSLLFTYFYFAVLVGKYYQVKNLRSEIGSITQKNLKKAKVEWYKISWLNCKRINLMEKRSNFFQKETIFKIKMHLDFFSWNLEFSCWQTLKFELKKFFFSRAVKFSTGQTLKIYIFNFKVSTRANPTAFEFTTTYLHTTPALQ
jgi:hypothetical protein